MPDPSAARVKKVRASPSDTARRGLFPVVAAPAVGDDRDDPSDARLTPTEPFSTAARNPGL